MIGETELAFLASLQMLTEGIEKIPDHLWRQEHSDDYLIPVRITYHIFLGLEWFVSTVPPEEHRKTRRYNLDWTGPVDAMPDRQEMLADLEWMTGRIHEWFAAWMQEAAEGVDSSPRMEKALYFLRHTQHHLGEFCAVARLLQQERPAWKYIKRAEAVKNNP